MVFQCSTADAQIQSQKAGLAFKDFQTAPSEWHVCEVAQVVLCAFAHTKLLSNFTGTHHEHVGRSRMCANGGCVQMVGVQCICAHRPFAHTCTPTTKFFAMSSPNCSSNVPC